MWKKLKDLSSPASLSPGIVISLTIRDPRLTFPQFVPRRDTLSATDPNLQSTLATALSPGLATSSIWDTSIRKSVSEMKRPEASINKEKSKLLVPGYIKDTTRIPILLVHRGLSSTSSTSTLSNTKSEYENGWTIILPRLWAKPLWRSLIFAGARATSIACLDDSVMYQAGVPRFPKDWIGTRIGIEDAGRRELERREVVERKPPAKRGFALVKSGDENVVKEWPGRFMFRGDLPRVVEQTSGMSCETDADVRVIYSPALLAKIKRRFDTAFSTWEEFVGDLALSEDYLIPVGIECVDGIPLDDAAVYTVDNQEVYDRFDRTQVLLKRSPVAETEWTAKQLDYAPPGSCVAGYVTSGSYSLAIGRGFAFATCSIKKLVEARISFGKGVGGRQWVLVRNRNGRRCRLGLCEILT
jgi:ribonuclease P/MRP protein subunit POP1